MLLTNVDLRHVETGVTLTPQDRYEALCARTAARQRDAKAELARRGVEPRIRIGSGWVPHYIARHFLHCAVGGVR